MHAIIGSPRRIEIEFSVHGFSARGLPLLGCGFPTYARHRRWLRTTYYSPRHTLRLRSSAGSHQRWGSAWLTLSAEQERSQGEMPVRGLTITHAAPTRAGPNFASADISAVGADISAHTTVTITEFLTVRSPDSLGFYPTPLAPPLPRCCSNIRHESISLTSSVRRNCKHQVDKL